MPRCEQGGHRFQERRVHARASTVRAKEASNRLIGSGDQERHGQAFDIIEVKVDSALVALARN